MMSLEWGDLDELQGIRLLFSRIRWENDPSDRRLRIATQGNLDCIYEIRSRESDKTDLNAHGRHQNSLLNCCLKEYVCKCKTKHAQ